VEESKKNRYRELDALRGIAALMVVCFHFTMGKDVLQFPFALGVTGVDLFFMISGFVIFMSLEKIPSAKEFIINRIGRLYPSYWTAVTFTCVLLIIHPLFYAGLPDKTILLDYLGNMTMFQYYLGINDLDGPYWTMIVEMVFYISILLLYQLKLLKHIIVIGAILCPVIAMLVYFYLYLGWVSGLIHWFPLLSFLPLFFAGILFYKIYAQRNYLLLNYFFVAVCLVCQGALFSVAGRSPYYITQSEYCGMLVLFFALFVLFVNNKLKFIVCGPTLFLGKISYALYLIHQTVSVHFILPLFTDVLHFNFWLSAIITLAVVICIASFITYRIEIPYSKKLKEKLRALL
jgi:peptidoglycan/LPS O-acetylase OafA/YrhL